MWEEKMKTATGHDAYVIKSTLIELRKDQYVVKNAYRRPILFNKLTHSKNMLPLDDNITIGEEGEIISEGVSLTNPAVCSAILCNYSKLKEDSWGNFEGDMWYLLYDFERTCDKALKKYPLYERIVECKIDGM